MDDLRFEWQMTRSEKFALHSLLQSLKPATAIEIGTYRGGSLQILATNALKVYSLDISPTPREKFADAFPNVEFLVGPSAALLPELLKDIECKSESLEFVLIDGDHTKEGVHTDISALLTYRPISPMTVVFHDSFHPPCRQGILAADWESCHYVQYLELDFIPGVYFGKAHDTAPAGSMYGGFAVAQFAPTPRAHRLTINCSHQSLFEIAYKESCYNNTIGQYLKNLMRGFRR